jgi:inorganic pyrophosphatase
VKKMNLKNINLGRHAPGVINVIVVTPKGSRKGYRYDSKRRRFVVDCTFGLPVPTDYGWLPQTVGEDNNPLEAMVITRYAARPGYVYQARPIGTLKQKNGEHKVICVMLGDDRFTRIQDISDLDNKTLKRIVNFFEPFFEFDGWLDKEETYKLIEESHRRYLNAKSGSEKDASGDDKVEPSEGLDRTDRSNPASE